MPSQTFLHGALLLMGAEFMFAAMGATIRVIADDVELAVIVLARNLVGLAILLPLLARRGRALLETRVPHLHLLRAVAGVSAMYCFFYAIVHMPLANAMLLKLSSPLFIPFVALLWLGEAVTLRVLVAVVVGFVGIGIILTPDFGTMAPVAGVALLGGVLASVAKVTVRRLSRTEPAGRILFYFALIASLVSAVPAATTGLRVAPTELPWLVAVGVLATLGQFQMTKGFAKGPAGRLSPFTYFSVVFAAIFGWLLWDEPLSLATAVGSLLVMAAGVLVARQSGGPKSGHID